MNLPRDPDSGEDAPGRTLGVTRTFLPAGADRHTHVLRSARAAGCTCTPDIPTMNRAQRRQRGSGDHQVVKHDDSCRLYRRLLAKTQ